MLPLIIVGIGAAVLGVIIGSLVQKQVTAKKVESAADKAEKLLAEAKNKAQEKLIEANDKALKIIEEAKAEEQSRRKDVINAQKRLEERENRFDQKLLDLESKQQQLTDRTEQLEAAKQKIHDIRDQQLARLEEIGNMSQEEAQERLLAKVEQDNQEALMSRLQKLQQVEADEMDKAARDMLTIALQRVANSQAAEVTTTTVNIASDEMKGRIIGREGRNIRVLEQLTGTEIIVDDTPQAITVSGFSPIRRHIAKQALEKLVSDGRIHPGRIEEAVEEAKRDIALDIKKSGEAALYELGITGFDPKLVQIIGRLKYRTSYGQNILQHSIEIAHLCALLAEQLGVDVVTAKKSGLLHDVGKAVDHEVQGTHPEIGANIGRKFGVSEEVIDAIAHHHDDKPTSIYTIIVKVADAISGARPGARKDTYENYLKRLEELEQIAGGFEGIEKCYAIQAGREVRVFVTPDNVDDFAAAEIARKVAREIENQLKYPGEIKVTVIREKRIIEYAR